MLLRSLFAAAVLAILPAAATAAKHPTGLHVSARISGPDGGWDLASFDAARRRVYIAHATQLIAVDVDSGKANFSFASGARLHGVIAVPGTDLLVSSNAGDDTARILSAVDGHVLATIPVAKDADGVQYDPKSGLVVVISADGETLTLIDAKAMKAVGTVVIGEKLEFGDADGQGRFFVNEEDKNAVAVVDLAARKVVATWPLKACVRPTGLAYVSENRVVVDCGDGGVNILDGGSGHVLAAFKVGGFPDAVIYDAQRQLAFVPSALSGEMSVVALSGKANNTIIDTIPTQFGARTGAVDPQTGRIYLPTAEYVLPATAGQRPATKPGTFNVLVLDR